MPSPSDRPLRALAWMALSAAGFTLMNVGAKLLIRSSTDGPALPEFELVFFRALVNVFWVSLLIVRDGQTFIPPRGTRRLLLLRGLAGFLSVSGLFYSVGHLPLPVASLLSWSSPLFAILISWALLGEKLRRAQAVWVPVAFLGLVILLNPDQGGFPLFAVSVGLGGAAFAGAAYVAVRKATATLGIRLIVLAFVGLSVILSLPLMLYQGFVVPTLPQAWTLLWLGTAATVGQLAMTEAYRHAKAAEVSLMGLLNPVFATLIGVWGFGEGFGSVQGLGALILCGAVVAIGWPVRPN